MFISTVIPVKAAPSEKVYDRNEALNYAKNHWDDGVGVCDEFVKDCLRAGGVDIQAGGVGPIMDALIKVGYGEKVDLVVDDKGYHFNKEDNPKVEVGDILFIYCRDCQKMLHTAFIGKFDEKGNLQVYGHNPAWDADHPILYLGLFHHIDKTTGKDHTTGYDFYAVHMTDDSWEHKHTFKNNLIEDEHPHKMYTECACGEMYYLGWNAKNVSMCTVCNPPAGTKPMVTVTKTETNGALISWTTVAGATGYNVYRSKSKTGSYFLLGSGNVQATSFNNTSIDKGQDYYFKVEAIKADGNVMSDPVHFIIADSSQYVKPVVTVSTFDNKPMLSWEVKPGSLRYEVYRANKIDGTYFNVFETNLGVYKHVSAEYDKTYYYKVKVYYSDNSVKESDIVSYTMPHVHSYTDKVVDPKCEDQGYIEHSCRCGDSYKDNFVAKLGHSFKKYVSDNNATTEKDGTKTAKCERCNATDTITDVGSKLPEGSTVCTGVTRVFGASRYETAFKVADTLKATLGVEKFDAVIVANGTNFADALAGSYLSSKQNAPILMTDKKDANIQKLVEYIKANLKADGTVYILGGTAAVSDKVEKQLNGFAVERLAGKDRYETNLKILRAAGGVGYNDLLVCTGTNFADSLSASATGQPMLLVGKKLTGRQKVFFAETLPETNVVIVGGEGAVNKAVEKELKKEYENVSRLAGASRYETSVMVADKYFEEPSYAVVALATNFPDGLSGGALAYALKSPLLLTNGQKANFSITAKYTNSQNITAGYVLGGNKLVTDEAKDAIFKK